MTSFSRNIASVYAVNFVNGVLSVVFIPYAISHLGRDGYGIYAVYTVLLSFLSLLDSGVGRNLMRLLSVSSDNASEVYHLRVALGIYLIISFILLLLFPLWIWLIPNYLFPVAEAYRNSLYWIILFVCLEFASLGPLSLIRTRCVARNDFSSYSRFVLLSGLYRYIVMLLAIWLKPAAIILVGAIVGRRFLDIITARSIMGSIPAGAWRPQFDKRGCQEYIKNTVGYLSAQSLQTLFLASGSFLVNRFLGLGMLGSYRAAFDLASRAWFFSNGISVVIFPKFSREMAGLGKARLGRFLPDALGLSLALYLALALSAVLLEDHILRLLHMNNTDVHLLFGFMMLACCLYAHSNTSYELFNAIGNFKVMGLLNLISLVVLTTTFLALYEHITLAAIGWGWLLSQLVFVIGVDIAACRLSGASIASYRTSVVLNAVLIAVAIGAIASSGSMRLPALLMVLLITAPVAFISARNLRGAINPKGD